jgi:hypothetical protein
MASKKLAHLSALMGDDLPLPPVGRRDVSEEDPEQRQNQAAMTKLDLEGHLSHKPVTPTPEPEPPRVGAESSRVLGVEAGIGQSFCPLNAVRKLPYDGRIIGRNIENAIKRKLFAPNEFFNQPWAM